MIALVSAAERRPLIGACSRIPKLILTIIERGMPQVEERAAREWKGWECHVLGAGLSKRRHFAAGLF
eukprot:177040-Hanusia_phi.AAC.2